MDGAPCNRRPFECHSVLQARVAEVLFVRQTKSLDRRDPHCTVKDEEPATLHTNRSGIATAMIRKTRFDGRCPCIVFHRVSSFAFLVLLAAYSDRTVLSPTLLLAVSPSSKHT